jgi:hypothetical protein
MKKIPALTGWAWVKEGFMIFRKQPAQFMMMFISYLFIMLGIGIIPVFGQLMPLLLAPVFSMLFMQACERVDRGEGVDFRLLLSGLRSPVFRTVLKLGGLYLAAAILAIGVSSLIDGGVFWKAMSGQIELEPETVRQSNMMTTLLIAALLYLPAAMAFWFAAPLIVWQKMGLFKAIFYSFFAVYHAGKAFLVYAAAWIVIGILLPSIISVLIAVLIGKGAIVMMLMFIVSILLTVVMYCSFYPTYAHVFGKPTVEEAQ